MQSKADLFTEELSILAEQAKALSHPARLEILKVLAAKDSCICGDLVDVLPLAQASVSRHLSTLKEAGLIRGEIDGPRSCYCVDRRALEQLRDHFEEFFDTVLGSAPSGDCC
jgi:ArsR family transcriptional regulator